jgi:hypothetical protein
MRIVQEFRRRIEMKRLIVVAAVVMAGCSSARNEAEAEKPLPPNAVVLANFTAEVDLAAGTFVVRTTPTAQSGALRASALQILDSDVNVTTRSGSVWIGDADHTLCTDPGDSVLTWGATVDIESIAENEPLDTSLSGVYAEITNFAGLTGYQSCSNDAGPAELNSEYGLWSYQLVDDNTGPISRNWVFKYPSSLGSSQRFSGRIVGVKIVAAPANPSSQWARGPYLFADTGTGIMTASQDNTDHEAALHLLDYAGEEPGSPLETPAPVTGMARAGARVWYLTSYEIVAPGWHSYAGYSTTDGTGLTFALLPGAAPGAPIHPANIVPDPVTPESRAWFLYNDPWYSNSYVRSYTPGAVASAWNSGTTYAPGDKVSYGDFKYESLQAGNLNHTPAVGAWWKYSEFGPATALGNSSYYIAVGADGRLYVSNNGADPQSISVFSISGDTAVLLNHFPITGPDSCLNPSVINPGPNSKVYFSGASAVCSVTTDGTASHDPTFEKFADTPASPGGFAFGPLGELWVGAETWTMSSTVSRVAAGADPYQVELSYPFGLFGVGAVFRANGKWWVTGNGGLFKFIP